MCRHEISADEYWEKYRIYRIRFHEEQEKHLIYMIKNHDNNEAKLKLKWFFKFILNVVFNKYYIFIGKIIIYDYLIHRSFGDEIFIDKNYYIVSDIPRCGDQIRVPSNTYQNEMSCYRENIYMYKKTFTRVSIF
jgi:hypothetical protein